MNDERNNTREKCGYLQIFGIGAAFAIPKSSARRSMRIALQSVVFRGQDTSWPAIGAVCV